MQAELVNKKNQKSADKERSIKTRNSFSLRKLRIIKNIKAEDNNAINSICLLKDKRLVSGGKYGLIMVYSHSYPQIQIKNAHDNGIYSLCALRNGDLASSSGDGMAKIWRIGENDYKLIHTLIEHTSMVMKVIELEGGRICSCSAEGEIMIWDNNTYQSITTIKAHTDWTMSIIEMNDSIISVSLNEDTTLRRWNKSTYECIQIIQNVCCCWCNALEKLNNHTVLIGGEDELFIVDIKSSEVKQLEDNTLGRVIFFRLIRNDLVLFGNQKGKICEYNPISNEIISKFKFHNHQIMCLIGSEQNRLISCSSDRTINIYKCMYI